MVRGWVRGQSLGWGRGGSNVGGILGGHYSPHKRGELRPIFSGELSGNLFTIVARRCDGEWFAVARSAGAGNDMHAFSLVNMGECCAKLSGGS